jgi:hypothetical protein
MFRRIDKHLKILGDNEQNINDRIQSYKKATKELLKIKNNINTLGEKVKDHNAGKLIHTLSPTMNIHDIDQLINTLNTNYTTIESSTLDTAVNTYCESIDNINYLINKLKNEKNKINRANKTKNKINIIDITKILLNENCANINDGDNCNNNDDTDANNDVNTDKQSCDTDPQISIIDKKMLTTYMFSH